MAGRSVSSRSARGDTGAVTFAFAGGGAAAGAEGCTGPDAEVSGAFAEVTAGVTAGTVTTAGDWAGEDEAVVVSGSGRGGAGAAAEAAAAASDSRSARRYASAAVSA